MLDHTDFAKMQDLMDEDEEFRILIQKLIDYHSYTLSSISHELRTPLTLLKSSLQLIESQHPEVKDYKYWAQSLKDIGVLNDILIEVTTFAKQTTLNCSHINLDLLISQVVDSYQRILTQTPHTLSYKCQENDFPLVNCDSLKIRQVLIALINNAIEALETKGTITICLSLEDNFAKIEVKDTGCGIPNDDKDKIFQLFATTKKNGTGIGLSRAQRIINSHRGSISFSSEKDSGTSFTILIPLNTNG